MIIEYQRKFLDNIHISFSAADSQSFSPSHPPTVIQASELGFTKHLSGVRTPSLSSSFQDLSRTHQVQGTPFPQSSSLSHESNFRDMTTIESPRTTIYKTIAPIAPTFLPNQETVSHIPQPGDKSRNRRARREFRDDNLYDFHVYTSGSGKNYGKVKIEFLILA